MIPYTIERRPDTGVNNVTLGIWLFLASEAMLFGALFSAYALLRVAAASWPHGRDVLDVGLGGTNTLVLVTLTFVVLRARRTGGAGRLWIASALAVVFLGIKTIEYRAELSHGLRPATSTFFALYYTLTGFHAAHVLAGVVANAWASLGARRLGAAITLERLRALARYWMFVDAIWLIVFVLLYLS